MRAPRFSPSRAAAVARLEEARERLWRTRPGGSPATAIPVTSAAVIEARVAAMTCPQCGGSYRLLEHTRPRSPLRQLDVMCRHCGVTRALWFALVPAQAN